MLRHSMQLRESSVGDIQWFPLRSVSSAAPMDPTVPSSSTCKKEQSLQARGAVGQPVCSVWGYNPVQQGTFGHCRRVESLAGRQAGRRRSGIDEMKKQPDTPASGAAGTQNAIRSAAPQSRVEVERRPPRVAARCCREQGTQERERERERAGGLLPSPTHVPLVLVTQPYVPSIVVRPLFLPLLFCPFALCIYLPPHTFGPLSDV
ncbi:hypothetical protein LX32DRAFT_20948 [Colletotrichum zoysiae]|uniref:Uncharacterized protein n=1 Tax=Colletotrichum zoysiae TaxID=1216348 RepID=A0AAD9LZA3_9PEZI|nr:hypothetical protein LX32DRAFT_20948 [Colletotrichum zoysiae]